ncbi:hypothetical protein BSKO_05579 [Bryopsis sp. KO-2023]|nr:hypothetical protein BSKO_05579 [Bryopsis sp. KO-2023]
MFGKFWASSDTGVLSKDRHKCYEARDKYYDCLDGLNRSEEGDAKDVPKECRQLRKAYEKNCRKTWVDHFDKLRTRDIQLLKTIAKNVKDSPQKGSLAGESQS